MHQLVHLNVSAQQVLRRSVWGLASGSVSDGSRCQQTSHFPNFVVMRGRIAGDGQSLCWVSTVVLPSTPSMQVQRIITPELQH